MLEALAPRILAESALLPAMPQATARWRAGRETGGGWAGCWDGVWASRGRWGRSARRLAHAVVAVVAAAAKAADDDDDDDDGSE